MTRIFGTKKKSVGFDKSIFAVRSSFSLSWLSFVFDFSKNQEKFEKNDDDQRKKTKEVQRKKKEKNYPLLIMNF